MKLNVNSQEYFDYCMANEKPYFGVGLHAQQVRIIRHAYMDKLVEQECLNRDDPYYILEIGSYAGMSAITWAKAIQKYNNGKGKVFCIDPWQPYLKTYEGTPDWDTAKVMNRALEDGQAFRLFLHNITTSNCKDNILVIKADSDLVLPCLCQEFNLIYIDGDHRYKQFKKDLMNSIALLKDQDIISGDDLEAEQDQVMGKFSDELEAVQEDYLDGLTIRYHPGVTKGVWDTFGSVSSWEGFWAMRKSGNGWERIILTDIENIKVPEHLKEWAQIYNERMVREKLVQLVQFG